MATTTTTITATAPTTSTEPDPSRADRLASPLAAAARRLTDPAPAALSSWTGSGPAGKIPRMGRAVPKKGNEIPRSGKRARARHAEPPPRVGIADALFSSTQQRVLGLIYGQPERSFTVSELIGLARAGSGAVQREVERLAQSGLVMIEAATGRKYIRANAGSPIFEELRGLVDKTLGIPQALTAALQPVADRVRLALLYGSVAKGTDAASSDIDVLIVSDRLSFEAVFALFAPVEERLGRRISPTLYTPEEFLRRRREHHTFLTRVLAGRHHILMGSVDAAGAAG